MCPCAILEVTLIRLGERCVLIVRVLGCTSSAASLTVISLNWPIISWISDATMDVLWVCIFGFVLSVVFVLPEGTFRGRLRRLSFSFLV